MRQTTPSLLARRTPRIDIVGRFPPPLDGQAIATGRLADLLAGFGLEVGRVDVGAPESPRFGVGEARWRRTWHYLGLPTALRRRLAADDSTPILWPSVSPSAPGHARDVALVTPAFGHRPVVGIVHVGDFDRVFRSPLTALTARRLVRRLHAFVFLSEALAERSAPFIPAAKRWVVPNTIGTASVPTPADIGAARARRAARDGLHLLFLSSMIPSKGYTDVLEATAVLRQRGVNVRARFVGRWPSSKAEATFRARADALGVASRVEVIGGVDRTEVARLLLDADVFALPTTYPSEAQPLTVIEALAAGTPVVATRHASLPEMITGPEGRFVEARAPTQIADAVVALCTPGMWAAASRAARARFEAAFSARVVGARWLERLGPLLGGSSA